MRLRSRAANEWNAKGVVEIRHSFFVEKRGSGKIPSGARNDSRERAKKGAKK